MPTFILASPVHIPSELFNYKKLRQTANQFELQHSRIDFSITVLLVDLITMLCRYCSTSQIQEDKNYEMSCFSCHKPQRSYIFSMTRKLDLRRSNKERVNPG
jgi:hypothetical protein|uniref:Uncharacterized protein n=1 Tax=Populus trichocarpa TaxID=3694 RepID=A0A2K1YVY8_POPTR